MYVFSQWYYFVYIENVYTIKEKEKMEIVGERWKMGGGNKSPLPISLPDELPVSRRPPFLKAVRVLCTQDSYCP